MMLSQARSTLRSHASPEKAKILQGYFKTGPGEYGEGDVFLGVTVPLTREVSKEFCTLPLKDIEQLMYSKIHEERLLGIFILIFHYKKADPAHREALIDFYLNHLSGVNNWDLVDSSAHQLLGDFLLTRDRALLYRLVHSENLWERRIAIVSTYAFIRQGEFKDTLNLAELLFKDPHDLLHKATGWMLREVGKKDRDALVNFLNTHAPQMPRVMLRYALEKFDVAVRKSFFSLPSSSK